MVKLKEITDLYKESVSGVNPFSAHLIFKLKQSNEKKIKKIYMVMYFVDFHRD
jgi:hypothetical protein